MLMSNSLKCSQTAIQDLNKFNILENISLGLGQLSKQSLLELLQFDLESILLLDKLL